MSPQAGDRIVNAMTIDVEDYFQVSAFDNVRVNPLRDSARK